MLHKYPENYQRINTKSDMYLSIAYQLLSLNIEKFESLNKQDMLLVDDYSESLFKDYHVIIVFSVMAIEAFVNDYFSQLHKIAEEVKRKVKRKQISDIFSSEAGKRIILSKYKNREARAVTTACPIARKEHTYEDYHHR